MAPYPQQRLEFATVGLHGLRPDCEASAIITLKFFDAEEWAGKIIQKQIPETRNREATLAKTAISLNRTCRNRPAVGEPREGSVGAQSYVVLAVTVSTGVYVRFAD